MVELIFRYMIMNVLLNVLVIEYDVLDCNSNAQCEVLGIILNATRL